MTREQHTAGVLELMIRSGMADTDTTIRDVKISGETATVLIPSDAPDGFAESVCDFAVGPIQEYNSQVGYDNSAEITQVRVKKPWRPWNAATCSL